MMCCVVFFHSSYLIIFTPVIGFIGLSAVVFELNITEIHYGWCQLASKCVGPVSNFKKYNLLLNIVV